jgi:hypothetical protein
VFIGTREIPQDQPSNAFVIEFLPLNTGEKAFPIQVIPRRSGVGGEWIATTVDGIVNDQQLNSKRSVIEHCIENHEPLNI